MNRKISILLIIVLMVQSLIIVYANDSTDGLIIGPAVNDILTGTMNRDGSVDIIDTSIVSEVPVVVDGQTWKLNN